MITKGRLSNNIISTVAIWIGGIPVVTCGWIRDGVPSIHSAEHWWVIVMNAVISTAVGMTVWNYILRTLRSYEASLLGASSVIFVALFAIPILGESLSGREIAGVSIMLLGLGLSQLRRGGP
jgi:drug/metabolite transporter (DMT)-like permease